MKGLAVVVIALCVLAGLALRPVCVPITDEGFTHFTVPIEQRGGEYDFYVKVFQQRDGRWHQCKTWISRALFF